MLETREQQAFVAGTAPCFLCDGFVEPELHRFHPGADVCLDCVSADELQGLQEDLNHAQRVNRTLLPRVPEMDGWELDVHYQPSRWLSGDFYDFLPSRGGVGLIVGDVVGKGLPAALLRATLQGSLRALAPEYDSPAQLLEKVNGQFHRDGDVRQVRHRGLRGARADEW